MRVAPVEMEADWAEIGSHVQDYVMNPKCGASGARTVLVM